MKGEAPFDGIGPRPHHPRPSGSLRRRAWPSAFGSRERPVPARKTGGRGHAEIRAGRRGLAAEVEPRLSLDVQRRGVGDLPLPRPPFRRRYPHPFPQGRRHLHGRLSVPKLRPQGRGGVSRSLDKAVAVVASDTSSAATATWPRPDEDVSVRDGRTARLVRRIAPNGPRGDDRGRSAQSLQGPRLASRLARPDSWLRTVVRGLQAGKRYDPHEGIGRPDQEEEHEEGFIVTAGLRQFRPRSDRLPAEDSRVAPRSPTRPASTSSSRPARSWISSAPPPA